MESFQRQALEFSKLTGEFDPSYVPQDGNQYLQKVAFEREKCPAIVVKPLKKSNNKTTAINVPEWNMQNIQPVIYISNLFSIVMCLILYECHFSGRN